MMAEHCQTRMPRDEVLNVAARLRGPDGCRLRNCLENTGKAQYAFNALQQTMLPDELRPPPGTAGKVDS